MALSMIFVVFDFPVLVIPNSAVFWPSKSVGVTKTGTVDTAETDDLWTRSALAQFEPSEFGS